ncbi:hypothetical protein F8O01_14350 [Pseudoclavibacter chungangensis]|uniref:Uncharacterized protein n=1 Tax=Pseudoclavibacter chungangensis TaxID=587635 RepID=A0A7J5BR61_9MICO|nr:hypothetical protein [Pseudoclavibacter chungangensis]KAB1654090.1 hypothetical protein F8O01_14350 [Pseudoclavibacter chungangensis]NYJ65995.1 hypothetical protein [Pseudoclavibacter chungangensis]
MLLPVDLPSLDAMRHRWAITAAVYALDSSDTDIRVKADGPLWLYDDHGGSWATLIPLASGEAVLAGNDRDHSTLVELSELLEGMPDWVGDALRGHGPAGFGFVYAHVDGGWWRAPYGTNDGFTRLRLPAAGDAELAEYIAGYVGDGFSADYADEDDLTDYRDVDPTALAAAVEAGPGVTREQLLALVRFPELDLGRGLAAAARFGTKR